MIFLLIALILCATKLRAKTPIQMENGILLTAGAPRLPLLGAGTHDVRIANVYPSVPEHKKTGFKDKDPQLAIVCKNADGSQFTIFANMTAYKQYSELTMEEIQSGRYVEVLGQAVDSVTGLRVKLPRTPKEKLHPSDGSAPVKPNNTDKAWAILEGIVGATGIPEGVQITETELIGREMQITLKEDDYVGDNGKRAVSFAYARPVTA